MRHISKIKKSFHLQQDQADCGVACLLSILRYYEGNCSLELLRELSGTNVTGTTLLGLYQCAKEMGFDAEAFEADINDLKILAEPCILHTLINDKLQHYIVCFGFKKSKFIIGNPATGISQLNEIELKSIWKSRVLLRMVPNSEFEIIKNPDFDKWRWFKKLIKKDLNILIISMLMGILITIFNLSTAIFSQKLIDKILPSGDKIKLITSLIILFLILIIRSSLNFIRQNLLLQQSIDFNRRIVSNFFKSLIHLPKSFFDTRKAGDLIARMNDTSRIQKNITYIASYVFIDLIILTVTATFIINYSLIVALIVFCFIPIVFVVAFSFSKSIKNNQEKVMIAGAINESNYIDTINGIIAVKANNKEILSSDKVKNVYGNLQDTIFDLGKLGNKFSIVNDITGIMLSLILITVSSFMVLSQKLKIGEMIAILSLTNTLIPAVSRLSQINIQLQESKVAFNRMYEFTSIKPEYKQEKLVNFNFEKLIIDNISFRFAGRKQILKNISLSIKKGETIALLGESGCGKSTLAAILQKFYSIEKGDILINNEPLQNIYTPIWRNVIASVPQEIKIFNGTILDNIAFSDPIPKPASIIDFCNEVGLHRFFENLPQNYSTIIGEEGINLSGGQKQIVALARALYRKPQILLLDEATSALDRNTEKFILQILKKKQDEMAIILITHKVQTAKIADRVYIIEGGVIQSSGTPNELIKSDNFFSQLILDATL